MAAVLAMPECPTCFGEGHHDFREEDAWFSEHYSDAQLAELRAHRGLQHPLGIVPCSECEGTGIVSEERRKDLAAASVAAVDQIAARVRDEGLA